VPKTSCGLSHTSLFKTGLNDETSTILEQSDDASGLFTHFSSRAFFHKANNRDNNTHTTRDRKSFFSHISASHGDLLAPYRCNKLFGLPIYQYFQRHHACAEDTTTYNETLAYNKGQKVLSHTSQHLMENSWNHHLRVLI
jgi:hypothetical protein